jgi:hypothetical protein
MTANVLPGWDSFYTMTGTAAATLIGLIFIVITLGAQISREGVDGAVHTFVTPSLIHFAGVLLQSLLILAPLPKAWQLGVPLLALGLGGLLYAALLSRWIRKVGVISPKFSDWLAYAGTPGMAGAMTASGGLALMAGWSAAPGAIASGMLLLLFGAIYQAWDLTLWIVRNRRKDGRHP